MQYTEIFEILKKKKKKKKTDFFIFFLIFAPKNIDRGYTLETPSRGGSYEYPQSKKYGVYMGSGRGGGVDQKKKSSRSK